MTVHELMKLIDAGYTKDEISALARDEPAAAPASAPADDPEPEQTETKPAAAAPDPAAASEQTPAEPANDPEMDKRLSGIESSIAKITKLLQQQNLRRDSMGVDPAANLETETDNIMASIIRPEPTKKKG